MKSLDFGIIAGEQFILKSGNDFIMGEFEWGIFENKEYSKNLCAFSLVDANDGKVYFKKILETNEADYIVEHKKIIQEYGKEFIKRYGAKTVEDAIFVYNGDLSIKSKREQELIK